MKKTKAMKSSGLELRTIRAANNRKTRFELLDYAGQQLQLLESLHEE